MWIDLFHLCKRTNANKTFYIKVLLHAIMPRLMIVMHKRGDSHIMKLPSLEDQATTYACSFWGNFQK